MKQNDQSDLAAASPRTAKPFAPATGYACLKVADPKPVPATVSVCPECGGRLWWQVTTTDGLRDLDVDCEDDEELSEGMSHCYWQSDWQPVLDRVRRWLGSGRGTHSKDSTT